MKKYYAHIWLDDFRAPVIPNPYNQSIAWIKDYDSFVMQVKAFKDKISDCCVHFDHDLGENSKDGYECAKFLVNWCIENGYDVPDYEIQSANPVGKQNIESIFTTYQKVKLL